MATKVEQIKKWAMENYEFGGSWIIETFTDEEIDQEFETVKNAMKYAKLMYERERECSYE